MEGYYSISGVHGDPFFMVKMHLKNAGEEEDWQIKALEKVLPIRWDCLKPDPLHILLLHSDCEGDIPWEECGPLADSLEKLIPLLPEGEAPGHIRNWRDKTQAFVDGLRLAFEAKEDVIFG
jgi:hypothetical protein